MAADIKGITIEIGADTKGLTKALNSANASIRQTQSSLKDVEKALKIDPKNTNLLTDKFNLLTESVDDAKDKLKTLQDVQSQMDAAGVDKNSEAYKSLQADIDVATAKVKEAEDALKSFGSVGSQKIKAVGEQMKEIGGKISSAGESLTKSVTVPIAAAAGASVAAWKEVDAAMDTITTKTGASGAALEDMQNRAKSIAETIPTDFQSAADAVGEVNTRFGLTGDALEQLSTQFIEFSNINNTDVSSSVDNVSSVLNAFGQGTSDAGSLLDALNQTGQATGVSMDTLAQDLQKNAAQFVSMGLNAQEAAGFMGAVEMSGLDTSTMLTGLTKAQKAATADGQTLNDSLQQFSETMSSNSSETEKLQAAYDLFGSRAGAAIYNAVQSGKLNLEDLSSTLGDFSGSVERTFNETLDPMDQMTVVLNNLKDLGAEIVDASAPMITEAMTQIKDVVTDLKAAWDNLSPGTQEAIVRAALIAAAVGPVITVIGKVIEGIGSILVLAPMVGSAITALASGPIGLIVAAIAGAVTAGVLLYQNWDTIKQKAQDLGNKISEIWNSIKSTTSTVFEGMKATIKGALDKITGFFSGLHWELPKIKLPHFSVTGSFSLNPPSIPHFGVEWYDKGGIFSSPTVIGVGEKRPEFVGALDDLRDIVREESGGNNTALMEKMLVLMQTLAGRSDRSDRSIEINVYQQPGQNSRDLVNDIQDRLLYEMKKDQEAFG